MIVTGESSGELYGALLAGAVKSLWPDVRVIGVGGERMRRAGIELFAGISSAFGFTEAVSAYKALRVTFKKTAGMLKEVRPDVVVLIDYPDFNFRVAAAAKTLGIPVLYYVSPQVWAWRKGRVKTMAGLADRMAVVLPFEEAIYRDSGIPCEFVGHPVMDEINALNLTKETAKELLGLEKSRPAIALLPGSRAIELRRLLPPMLEAVRTLKKDSPQYGFLMPLAPNLDIGEFGGNIDAAEKAGVKVVRENALPALAASEAAVIASGTAALQAAFLERPMVVIYKASLGSYLIAKSVIKVKYINLVNIILDRPAVPELIQGRATADNILRELRPLLQDGARRKDMTDSLGKVKAMFEGKRPSVRVAEMAGEMAGWGR